MLAQVPAEVPVEGLLGRCEVPPLSSYQAWTQSPTWGRVHIVDHGPASVLISPMSVRDEQRTLKHMKLRLSVDQRTGLSGWLGAIAGLLLMAIVVAGGLFAVLLIVRIAITPFFGCFNAAWNPCE